MRPGPVVLLASLLALAAPPLAASTADVPSAWLPTPATAEIPEARWKGVLVPVGDSTLSLGVRNDADVLYLRVRTSDPDTRRQILRTGLAVWPTERESRRGATASASLSGA